jgi:polysaccharide pyruvyl transferase WcaK-like protein
MRLLVLHAWLKGNLGDVLQLSVLLSALRELRPRVLDLAGFPAQAAPETQEVLTLADRYLPDPFPWYWTAAPSLLRKAVFERRWMIRRGAFFSRYDGIICAPGPYLANYDARAMSALCDLRIASELGLPAILSSHSIGPLSADGLAAVAAARVRIAREPSTYRYLCEHGMSVVLSADLAFLYPYSRPSVQESPGSPYRAIFLRSNNLDARRLRVESGTLIEGSRVIAETCGDRLVLATTDYRRDERFLRRAARTLGVSWVACRSVAELVQLIAGSSGVVSDRYHPAICAAVLGKPSQIVLNREPHKMQGLKSLLSDSTLEELQELARTGLRTMRAALRPV